MLLKLTHKCYSKLLKISFKLTHKRYSNSPTNVTQNYLKFLQTLLKLTHKCYSKLLKIFANVIQIDPQALLRLILRALKLIYKDCTIKTLNKIKQNCAKKR